MPDNCENGYLMPFPDALEPQPDGTLDDADEIVFMARDAGPRVPADQNNAWVAGADDERYEVVITDPNDPNTVTDNTNDFVYVFKFSTTHTPQYSTPYYVDWSCLSLDEQLSCVAARNAEYQPDLTCYGSGTYAPCRWFKHSVPGDMRHFGLPTFETRYIGNWINDGLRVKFGSSPVGPNILDRIKLRLLSSNFETEKSWSSKTCHVLLGQKLGPVRAIRYVMGAESGITTTLVSKFYDTYIDWDIKLRVHPLIHDLRFHPDFYWDTDFKFYSAQAGTLSTRDIVNGQGSSSLSDQFSDWTQIVGYANSGKGGMAYIALMLRPIPVSAHTLPTASYEDSGLADLDSPERQDGTYGNFKRLWGSAPYGNMVDRKCVANNDPTGPEGAKLCYAEMHTGSYLLPDDAPASGNAPDFQKWEGNPFQISSVAESRGSIPVPPPPPTCVPTFTLTQPDTGDPDQGRFSQISGIGGCTGMAGFHVYKSVGLGPFFYLADLKGSSLYEDFGVQPGSTFRYKIRAYNWMNVEGPASTLQQIGVHDLTAPQVPTNLLASPGDASATLSWSNQEDPCGNIPNSNVYMSSTSGGPWVIQNGSPLGGTSWTQTGLTNGQTYYFAVTAVDGSGNESAYSAQAGATPAP